MNLGPEPYVRKQEPLRIFGHAKCSRHLLLVTPVPGAVPLHTQNNSSLLLVELRGSGQPSLRGASGRLHGPWPGRRGSCVQPAAALLRSQPHLPDQEDVRHLHTSLGALTQLMEASAFAVINPHRITELPGLAETSNITESNL